MSEVVWQDFNVEPVITETDLVMGKAFTAIARDLKATTKRMLSTRGGGRPSPAGMSPNAQTGNLKKNVNTIVGKDFGGWFALCGVWGIPYARIQEMGGVISAKNQKYLAIPVSKAAKDAAKRGWGPWFPGFSHDLFYMRREGKTPLLVRKRAAFPGGPSGIEVMYVLTPRVYLPPRPYLRPALYQTMPKIVAHVARAAGVGGSVPRAAAFGAARIMPMQG